VCRCFYCNLTYIPLGICLGEVLLDHMAVLFSVFWGASILFSIVVVLIYVPTSSVWRLLSPHIFANILLLLGFLMIVIPPGVRWNLNVVFNLHFLYGQGCWAFLSCVFWTFGRLPLRKFYSVNLPISSLGHWFFFFFWVW
jgi:hypothetical protein